MNIIKIICTIILTLLTLGQFLINYKKAKNISEFWAAVISFIIYMLLLTGAGVFS